MRKTLSLLGLLICISISARTVDLGMTKEELIDVLGKPDKEIQYQGDDMFVYGLDAFSFVDGRISRMVIRSRLVPLQILRPEGIKVGDRETLVTKSPEGTFKEEKASSKDHRFFIYQNAGDDRKITIRTKDGVIVLFAVFKIFKDDIPLSEFKMFFSGKYKPTGQYPENTPWPGKIKVIWDQAVIGKSADAGLSTCIVPFSGELVPSAKYSEEDCPAIAGRIAVSIKSESGSKYRRDIISIVPKAGQKNGEPFTGFLVYTNVNSGKINGWEYYWNGQLLYCDFPTYNPPVKVSDATLKVRLENKLVFIGGENGISEEDWHLIAANRIGAPLTFSIFFPGGLNVDVIDKEKKLFTFSSLPNEEFKKSETDAKSIQSKPEGNNAPVDDTPLPKFVGKSDNLSSIITLKESPLKLEFEHKKSTRGDDEYVAFLTCDNDDWCDYTIKMQEGTLYRVFHGKTTIEDIKGSFRYWWFRGDAISKVNAQYPYAMPVAPGTKVKFMNDPREKHRSFALLTKTGEPAFAMRAGRVCKTDNDNSVLVVHKDGTFAAYMNVDERTVYPGDSVNPGDPIGKCGAGKLSISIFYLDRNKIQSRINDHYTHLTPYLRTEGGDVKLETGVEYTSFIDTDLITKEMSGLQKKNYLKKGKK